MPITTIQIARAFDFFFVSTDSVVAKHVFIVEN